MLNFKNMATVSMLNNPSISSSHMPPPPNLCYIRPQGAGFCLRPAFALAAGCPLDLAEHPHPDPQQACRQEQGQQRVAGHQLPHRGHQVGDGGHAGQNRRHSGGCSLDPPLPSSKCCRCLQALPAALHPVRPKAGQGVPPGASLVVTGGGFEPPFSGLRTRRGDHFSTP